MFIEIKAINCCLTLQATTEKRKSPSELALSYFDTYYKPVYGPLWPSMRIAMLSQQKYCALINNFADSESALISLIESGADDFVHNVTKRDPSEAEEHDRNTGHVDITNVASASLSSDTLNETSPESVKDDVFLEETTLKNDLYEFMPVKRIRSEKEELHREEIEQGFYRPSNIEINIHPDDVDFRLPLHLKACVHERGNVSLFPTPRKDNADKLSMPFCIG